MNSKDLTRISKSMSYILRHKPESIGIELDHSGWVEIDLLLREMGLNNLPLSVSDLMLVVEKNSKQRFELNPEKTRIRARQGHSAPVDLGYEPTPPPAALYHGTSKGVVAHIMSEGLSKMQRHHVHLHDCIAKAIENARRRSNPIVFSVKAAEMHSDGHVFYCTGNNVWLTSHIQPQYLRIENTDNFTPNNTV